MTAPKIQFVDLVRQYQNLKPELDAAMLRVAGRGDFILGEDVREFEKEFAAFNQVPFCIGVANGTDALHLALLALGITPLMIAEIVKSSAMSPSATVKVVVAPKAT